MSISNCMLFRLGCLLLSGAAIFAGGCDEAAKRSLSAVTQHYNAGGYRQALVEAGAIAAGVDGTAYDQARYLAGLSAYRLGRDDEAMRYLRPLTKHTDAKIAGSANATVGLIHAAYHRDQQALLAFNEAIKRLRGADAGKAHYHLALSQQKLGLWRSSRAHLDMALQATTDPALRKVIRQRQSANAFTLQLGAYGQRKNADDRAREMRANANRVGAGTPSVVPTISHRRRLYLVQTGRFRTHAEARKALAQLRTPDVWVVTR